MKIVLDFPDMPHRKLMPFPMEFEGSAGYLVVLVNRVDNKLTMIHTVGRAPFDNKNAVEIAQEDAMMAKLEAYTTDLVREFNT